MGPMFGKYRSNLSNSKMSTLKTFENLFHFNLFREKMRNFRKIRNAEILRKKMVFEIFQDLPNTRYFVFQYKPILYSYLTARTYH